MAFASPLFPDPVAAASIYCAGFLDLVIFRAVAVFWRRFLQHDPAGLHYLWLMRYGKGGEHLKVRIHGPELRGSRLRKLLEAEAARLFASLPAAPASPPRSLERAPAIDVEDAEGDHPDRTLLWTTYQRSPVSLGGEPLLEADRYAALVTRSLASGSERVLALQPSADGSLPRQVRQGALLRAVIEGLATPGFPAGKRAEYLAYHRDWLVRFILPADRRAEPAARGQLLHSLDERVAGMDGSLLPLRRRLEEEWTESGTARPLARDLDAGWGRPLSDLLAYIIPLCRDPQYHLDPFASDPFFAPLFKVFHGLANQLGLRQADEAVAYHILLRLAVS